MKNMDYKEAYARLKKEYQVVLDSIDDGIFVISNKGIIINVNRAVEKNGGKKTEELIGRNIDELSEEGYCNEFVSKIVIETGQQSTMIQRVNDNREMLVTGIPYYENQKLKMVIACERDITELTTLRKKLLESNSLVQKYENEINYLRLSNLSMPGLIFISKAMEKVVELAKRIARLDTTVLLQGESGSGKEVLAKLIYENSPRNDKPFVKINCGAIPENLLESELFGYVEGAFTGAKKGGKMGYFEIANGGTIFLDEINEIPLNLQVKLLRVIQEREVVPVGGTIPISLDLRIITATNKNLKELAKEGNFRQDLYYRLGVMAINIPPLRERREDIIELALYFLKQFNEKFNFSKELHPNALKCLSSYDWPGNVRELENVVERLLITTDGQVVCESDVEEYLYEERNLENETDYNKIMVLDGNLDELVGNYEAKLLNDCYLKYKDTQKMAEIFGTTRSTINRKLKKYDIR